jgi:hypothetical protein
MTNCRGCDLGAGVATIKREVAEAGTITAYREPLVGFAAAEDPRFPELRRVAEPTLDFQEKGEMYVML